MEDDEKVRYVLMLGVISFIFTGPMTELFKWLTLVAVLIMLLAIILFAVDGIVLDIIPDRVMKIIAWLGVLLTAVLLVIWWLALPEFFNITLP